MKLVIDPRSVVEKQISRRSCSINFAKMFENFFAKLSNLVPKVRADDDELIDPQVVLKEQCREDPHIQPLIEKYEACNDRVNSKSRTTETCTEELFDMLHAIDHCVTPKLFSKLK